ncbi:hypothetical protein BABA_14412 [Neobacillus bataviensis LMG 21833]|uniref:Uncharacterized protein n=1 Tax=Neobacillus bataviensis LMG 21833 TaxID=1117379 RepID=K6DF11_9BACI|nr:hypothetical protein [Neobacillus bataviensis]EKN66658.1 hypothetical protein BABA_14412 [Neobacillus bataviensis LMG 21833]
MKTKHSKTSDVQQEGLKKNVLFINMFFFAVTAFSTLVCYQFSNVIQNQFLLLFVYFVMFISAGLFIYGLWLRRSKNLKKAVGLFSGVYCLLVSTLLFLTSNVLYDAAVVEGTIIESIHYFSFSLLTYFVIIIISAGLILILSSPKVLNWKIITTKAYVWASILGIAIVLLGYAIMMQILNHVFNNPVTVKPSYEILISSVGFGYIAIAILILTGRAKSKGAKRNG